MSQVTTRTVAVALTIVGIATAFVLLVVPVHASFADDPILALRGFDPQGATPVTSVDCGWAPANVDDPTGIGTVYELARSDACHRAGYRRFWLAIATGATLMAGGLVAAGVDAQRDLE